MIVVCAALSLAACQKEVSEDGIPATTPVTTTSTVVPDDPERVANITLVKSADFVSTVISNDGRFDNGGNKRNPPAYFCADKLCNPAGESCHKEC